MGDGRLHKQIMNQLLTDLLGRESGGDTVVLREIELATKYDVSRGVIRETLRGMEERGIVVVKHGRGASVSPRERWDVLDPDVLAVLLDSEERAGVLFDLLECRRVLELEAVAQAARRATDEDIEMLSESAAQTLAAASVSHLSRAGELRFLEADVHFHRTLMDAARNRVLSRIAESIQRALVTTRATFTDPASRSVRLGEHTKIVDAIRAHDAAAAQAVMSEHLTGAEEILVAHLRADELPTDVRHSTIAAAS